MLSWGGTCCCAIDLSTRYTRRHKLCKWVEKKKKRGPGPFAPKSRNLMLIHRLFGWTEGRKEVLSGGHSSYFITTTISYNFCPVFSLFSYLRLTGLKGHLCSLFCTPNLLSMSNYPVFWLVRFHFFFFCISSLRFSPSPRQLALFPSFQTMSDSSSPSPLRSPEDEELLAKSSRIRLWVTKRMKEVSTLDTIRLVM